MTRLRALVVMFLATSVATMPSHGQPASKDDDGFDSGGAYTPTKNPAGQPKDASKTGIKETSNEFVPVMPPPPAPGSDQPYKGADLALSPAVENNLNYAADAAHKADLQELGITPESADARAAIHSAIATGNRDQLTSIVADAAHRFPDDPTFASLAVMLQRRFTQADHDRILNRAMEEGRKLYGIQVVDVESSEPADAGERGRREQLFGSRRDLRSAYARINRKDYGHAVTLLDTAIQRNPTNAFLYDARTIARLHSGDLKGADQDSLLALKYNPTGTDAFVHRAMVMQEMGKMGESRGWLEEALKLDPFDESALMLRGTMFFDRGDFARALADYKTAAQIDPSNLDLYRHAVKEARAQAQTVVKQNASSHMMKGNYAAALKDTASILAVDPTNADVRDMRGIALVKTGQFGEAIKNATIALKANPRDAHALITRAMALEALGSKARAQADYKLAAEIDPSLRPTLRKKI